MRSNVDCGSRCVIVYLDVALKLHIVLQVGGGTGMIRIIVDTMVVRRVIIVRVWDEVLILIRRGDLLYNWVIIRSEAWVTTPIGVERSDPTWCAPDDSHV